MRKMLLIAAALFAGCVKEMDPKPVAQVQAESPTYLCVGMEMSKRFGECPGCRSDAIYLSSLMGSLGYKGDLLISSEATKDAVVEKLKKGIDSTPENGLFLFFYSGHGGQEFLGGKEPDGSDREDEYLCLYDSHMMDDEIWSIVSKCKGRVFLYFDACHSATMYRSVASVLAAPKDGKSVAVALGADLVRSKGFTLRAERFVKARALSSDGPRAEPKILCWSGCREAEYSFGSFRGGELTLAVAANWKKGVAYDDLWAKVRSWVNSSQKTQHPVQTILGGFPVGAEAFR